MVYLAYGSENNASHGTVRRIYAMLKACWLRFFGDYSRHSPVLTKNVSKSKFVERYTLLKINEFELMQYRFFIFTFYVSVSFRGLYISTLPRSPASVSILIYLCLFLRQSPRPSKRLSLLVSCLSHLSGRRRGDGDRPGPTHQGAPHIMYASRPRDR